MLLLATPERTRFLPGMAEPISVEQAERRLLGRALAELRRRAGPGGKSISQQAAADRLHISVQAWQKYEAGARRFTTAQVAKVTAALGGSPEELMMERARLLGQIPRQAITGLGEREQRPFEIPVWGRAKAGPEGPQVYDAGQEPEGVVDLRGLRGPSIGATRIAGDSMVPWGEPGEVVIFDRDRWPSRGAGCVIETEDGGLYVKLYDHSDEAHVFARQFNPEKLVPFRLSSIKGVYAIRLRGD